jgi:HlyD family secretion protein
MTQSSADIARVLSDTRDKGRRRLSAAILAAVVIAGAGVAWYLSARATATITYQTEPVVRGALTVTVTATGTVQPTTEVEVSSELSGTLASVEVDFNEPVGVGQVLARLDDTKLAAQVVNAEASLAAAEAQVDRAKATLHEAETNFRSQEALEKRGVVTTRDFVSYAAAFDRAKADLAIAAADRTLAAANLDLRRADLEKSVIRSPVKGIVLDRAVEAGQIVASSLNAPVLFKLAEDLSRMDLKVDIDEADIGRVKIGDAATFTVDAFPGRSFPAAITQVRYAPETTEGVVTYKAVLSVDNAALLLRPGMTATATITVAEVADALLVPNAALRFAPPQLADEESRSGSGLLGLILPRPPRSAAEPSAGANTLWVLRDGAAAEVEIAPGETNGRQTAVTSDALVEGDLVITDQTTGT